MPFRSYSDRSFFEVPQVGKTRSDAAQGPIALAMRRSERKDVLLGWSGMEERAGKKQGGG